MKIKWEYLSTVTAALANSRSWRLKVPGGWILRTWFVDEPQYAQETTVFVPDPNHEWQEGWEEKREKESSIHVLMEKSRVGVITEEEKEGLRKLLVGTYGEYKNE